MKSKITNSDNNRFLYRRSEEIIIPRSDLQIKLEKFKKKISSNFSVFDFLALLSLWAPIFTGDFRGMFNFAPLQIQAVYVTFSVIITILILYKRSSYYIFFRKEKVSDDPEVMSRKILDECISQNTDD